MHFLHPLLAFRDLERPINWTEIFGRSAPLHVEIGFGLGEVIIENAQKNPEQNFIGIEQHWERFYRTLSAMDRLGRQQSITNIRLLFVDARVSFERLFEQNSVNHIECLFPCPWPKVSHVKHRLFDSTFQKLINNRLKDQSSFRVVTDFYPYMEWVSEHVDPQLFQVSRETLTAQFNTKFEKKWSAEGQEEFFELRARKIAHAEVAIERDEEMKNYRLKEFNYNRFEFEDYKKEVAVIFKDKLFDQVKNEAMIYCVVSEGHLNQHVWVKVAKRENDWIVQRAEGQSFFPTKGVNRLIEQVYKAALKTIE